MRTWNSGPPPHIGWWQASNDRTQKVWRFWFGEHWSGAVWDDMRSEHIGANLVKDTGFGPIEWTDYYPENARVPRLDPTDGHWTFGLPPVDAGVVELMIKGRPLPTRMNAENLDGPGIIRVQAWRLAP